MCSQYTMRHDYTETFGLEHLKHFKIFIYIHNILNYLRHEQACVCGHVCGFRQEYTGRIFAHVICVVSFTMYISFSMSWLFEYGRTWVHIQATVNTQ